MTCPGINGTCCAPRSSRSSNTVLTDSGLCQECETASTTMPSTPCSIDQAYIHDPILGYIAAWRDVSRKTEISHIVSNHFDRESIDAAKKLLWEKCSVDIIGAMPGRRDTDDRSRKVAHIDDIFDAMRKLDDADSLPNMAVTAHQLRLLPKAAPGELLSISVVERLDRFDHIVTSIVSRLDDLSNENSRLRDSSSLPLPTINIDSQLHGSTSTTTASYAGVTNKTKQKKKKNPAIVIMPDNSDPSYVTPVVSAPSAPTSLTRLPGLEQLLVPRDDSMSRDNSLSRDKDGFALSSNEKRRNQRVNARRKKAIAGTAAWYGTLRGDPPNRDVYIYRVHMEATIEDLRKFAISQDLTIKKLSDISNPEYDTKSYILTVPATQLDKSLNPDTWPEGICVRRYFPPRNKAATDKSSSI